MKEKPVPVQPVEEVDPKKEEAIKIAERQLAKEDFEKRIKVFQSEIIPLYEKHKIGLMARATIAPNGTIQAVPVYYDDSQRDKPSKVDKPKSDLEVA